MKPTNASTRLDIVNLHDRMAELYRAFYTIAGDLENQLKKEVEQDEIDAFASVLDRLKDRIHWFLGEMKPYVEKEHKQVESHSFGKIDIEELLADSNMQTDEPGTYV